MLTNQTRILVTHGITWLQSCDVIVVMSEGGTISECGHYDDLISHNKVFAQFIQDFLHEQDNEDDEDKDDAKEGTEITDKSPSGKGDCY